MLCLHHTDADGWCSAAIVNHFNEDEDKKFYAITYGDKLPIHLINKNEIVYIVDYSLNSHDWEQLFKLTKNVIWIDHHKTAIENKQQPHSLPGLRINGIAACMLTWIYFNYKIQGIINTTPLYTVSEMISKAENSFEKIPPAIQLLCEYEIWRDIVESAPEAIQLVGDFDVWTFAFGERTRFFQRGLYTQHNCNNPDSDTWEILISKTTDAQLLTNCIVSDGSIIDSYMTKSDKSHVKRHARLIWFEGLRIYVANSQFRTSWLFDSINSDEYDGLAVFVHNGENWTISFYTPHDHINMSTIAKKYGGGGHRNACGCSLDELPFDFKNLVNKD